MWCDVLGPCGVVYWVHVVYIFRRVCSYMHTHVPSSPCAQVNASVQVDQADTFGILVTNGEFTSFVDPSFGIKVCTVHVCIPRTELLSCACFA